MSTKQFYHDIDLVKVGQLIDARIKNIDNAGESTLAGTLGAGNAGLIIYNTDSSNIKIWNGTSFQSVSADVTGDVVFQGVINPTNSDTGAISAIQGYQYVVDASGTITKTGVTFSPSAVVEVGDMVLFTSTTTATVLQRNVVDATTSQKGQVELATTVETDAGVDTSRAVTPASLANILSNISTNATNIGTNSTNIGTIGDLTTTATNLVAAVEELQGEIDTNAGDISTNATNIGTIGDLTTTATNLVAAVEELQGEIDTNTSAISTLQGRDNVLAYTNASVNVVANTPLTVNHALGLSNKDFFTIRVCDASGSSVSIDVDSVDVNNITLTSLVSLTGLKVFILGI